MEELRKKVKDMEIKDPEEIRKLYETFNKKPK